MKLDNEVKKTTAINNMEKYINRSKKTKVINSKESDDVQEERSQLVRTEAKNQLQTSGKKKFVSKKWSLEERNLWQLNPICQLESILN